MWQPVAGESDLFPGESMVVRVGAEEFALHNVNGRYHATGNRCPHQGGSLGDGYLEGNRIICPLHGWEFDVATGHAATPMQPGRIRVYDVKVEQGRVWVDVPEI